MTTLLATMVLATTLQNKTAIVHDFKANAALKYDLTYNLKLADGDSVSKAQFEIKSLKSYQSGNTDIELRLSKVNFVEGEVQHAFKSAVFGFTLNRNGVPIDSVFDSIESMASASLIALFIPGKQMAEGDQFDFKYDGDSLSLKLKGQFVSVVEKNGLRLAKLVSNGTVSPSGESIADISLTTLYDAVGKRIVEAHAVIVLAWGDIEIDLVAKP